MFESLKDKYGINCSLNKRTIKEDTKTGITKTYDLTADSKLEGVSIAGYKIVHKKVLKEKNGWRTMVLLEYKIS